MLWLYSRFLILIQLVHSPSMYFPRSNPSAIEGCRERVIEGSRAKGEAVAPKSVKWYKTASIWPRNQHSASNRRQSWLAL